MILKRCFGFISRTNNGISQFDIFSKNGSQLSQIIRIASQKNYDDDKFWGLIKTRLQYVYKTLNARNLSFIANGLSRAGFKDAPDWDCIVSRAYELSDALDFQDLALLFNSLCKVEALDPKIFSFLIEQIKKKSGNIGHRYAAMIVYSLGRIKLYDPSLMKILLKSINNSLNNLSLISISSLLNGFYHLDKYDLKLMILLIEPLKERLKFNKKVPIEETDASKFLPNKLVEMKTIVSIYQAYCHSGIYDKELYNILFQFMIENSDQLKMVEMIIISNCMNTSKLHNLELIERMNKKIIRKPKSYYYDGVSMYLGGLLNVKYVPKDSIEKIMDSVGYKKFKGSLNVKNNVLFLQIVSKFSIENERLYQSIIDNLITNKAQLTQSDLTNIVCCCNCVEFEQLNPFIKLFFDVFDKNLPESAQQLSRILYSLSKFNCNEFEDTIDRMLGYLSRIELERLEPINVANILYSLDSIKNSEDKAILISGCSKYLKEQFSKFSNQLLSSSLSSLTKMNRVDDEMVYVFCHNSHKLAGCSSLKDNLRILNFLNSYNYFRDIEQSDLRAILESYKIVLNNVASVIDDSKDNNVKYELNVSEKEIVQSSHNIVNMIECKLGVANITDCSNKIYECRQKPEQIQINM